MIKIQKRLKLNNSCKLYTKALKYLPTGVSSNARLWRNPTFCYVGPAAAATLFIKRAYGSKIWDVDGNEYIDYRLGFGPVILGHSYPKVANKVADQVKKRGTVYAFNTELELEVAQRLIKAIPCAESVKFANTGTEATLHAIQLARGYTRKNVILKFEGHYHGWHDYVQYSTHPPYSVPERKPFVQTAGIPKDIEKYIIIERWNDFHSVEETVRERHNEIAAIITEPIMGNAGGITPRPGYLKFLRDLCDQYGIVLIFDEVKTGFRVAYGGAQELYKVKPHVATYAKAMSNGYTISAVVGEKEVMDTYGVGPHKVSFGGTYNANMVGLTATNETLKILSHPAVYRHLNKYGTSLINGIKKEAKEADVPVKVLGVPELFQLLYTEKTEIDDYEDLRTEITDFYVKVQYELLKRGIMIDADNQECIYMSYSHTDDDLKRTIDAFGDAIRLASKTDYPKVPPFVEPSD